MSREYILLKLVSIPAILFALTFHEYAHGFTAYKLGDPTAKYNGRLSLNPLAHLDPVGALLMLLVGFGWARPVPVNPRYFKKPKQGMALTALMGPVANILLALLSALLFQLVLAIFGTNTLLPENLALALTYFLLLLKASVTLNLSFALFNLIPLPPLDGSRIIGLFLPHRIYLKLLEKERQISFFFLIWLLFGSRVAQWLLTMPGIASSRVLTIVVKSLSITGWLGDAVSFFSDMIFRLVRLIPFLNIS